jgi:hypothetical protein
MMIFKLIPTVEAARCLHDLEKDPAMKAQCKAVKKALGYMESNLKHAGLHTHKHTELSRQYGLEIFESYAQNNTPGAYRIFWHYGKKRGEIVVVSIVKHPD